MINFIHIGNNSSWKLDTISPEQEEALSGTLEWKYSWAQLWKNLLFCSFSDAREKKQGRRSNAMYLLASRCHQISQNGPFYRHSQAQIFPMQTTFIKTMFRRGLDLDNKSPRRVKVRPIHHVAVGERGTISSANVWPSRYCDKYNEMKPRARSCREEPARR